MRDPHVQELKYNVRTQHTVSFIPSVSLVTENDQFVFRLSGEALSVLPKGHYPSLQEARNAVEPFLRAWELDDALRLGSTQFTFAYQDVTIVDRDPPPPGASQQIVVASAEIVLASDTVTATVTRGTFPDPPSDFMATPDAESMWNRYEGYTAGKEPLLSMAYFCLTLVEARGGDREGAAASFKISRLILRKLGELTSARDDASAARKYPRQTSPVPLTPAEARWIEAAIRAIIRRVGQFPKLAALQELNIADLPPI